MTLFSETHDNRPFSGPPNRTILEFCDMRRQLALAYNIVLSGFRTIPVPRLCNFIYF